MKKKVVALLGLGLLPVTSVFAEEAKNVETNKLTTIEEKSANLKDVGENKLTKEIPQSQYKEVKEETKELKTETKETKTTKEQVEKTVQVPKEKLVVPMRMQHGLETII